MHTVIIHTVNELHIHLSYTFNSIINTTILMNSSLYLISIEEIFAFMSSHSCYLPAGYWHFLYPISNPMGFIVEVIQTVPNAHPLDWPLSLLVHVHYHYIKSAICGFRQPSGLTDFRRTYLQFARLVPFRFSQRFISESGNSLLMHPKHLNISMNFSISSFRIMITHWFYCMFFIVN